MRIFIGTDHTGYELKEKLKIYLSELELGYEVIDQGAFEYNKDDDYPDFIRPVRRRWPKMKEVVELSSAVRDKARRCVPTESPACAPLFFMGKLFRKKRLI